MLEQKEAELVSIPQTRYQKEYQGQMIAKVSPS
jgi:hypothetical protein